MKPTKLPTMKTSIFAHLKLPLTALANLLVVIVTLLSVAHGLMTSRSMADMSIWCLMGVTTLLMLMIVLNYTSLVKLIRTWKPSSNGGKVIYIKRSKNLE